MSGHYIITPDNGTLAHAAKLCGLSAVRPIDETQNRLPGTIDSYIFHGRDIYAYTGARLVEGQVSFRDWTAHRDGFHCHVGCDSARLP